jgi:GDP/UDP-N,N'-diacetylbacillosamine 2-epimerase (hydrolysing)
MRAIRRILVTLESRATYGYSKNVMNAMRDFPGLELSTLVTGAHLVKRFGNSVDLIEADGFPISIKVEMNGSSESKESWSEALGVAISGYAKAYSELKPDIILLSGDRIETLGCCIAAAYMGIPIAHIQAGDKSGHIDDSARHAIGKFSHIHLASCQDSVDRLVKMGEQKFRIHNVGAPQLDDINQEQLRSIKKIDCNGVLINLEQPYLLVLQHPVLVEAEESAIQMDMTLMAAAIFNMPVIVIYPNSDFGNEGVISVIEKWRKKSNFIAIKNMNRFEFLSLLANAKALIGNSSSGILEAPSLKTPVINIGSRQRGRPQAENILNCDYETSLIQKAIFQALNDENFKKKCNSAVNPYGDGKSSARICAIMQNINLDLQLIDKACTY